MKLWADMTHDEKVAHCKQGLKDGLSAAASGAQVCASRNAILGIIHRSKLAAGMPRQPVIRKPKPVKPPRVPQMRRVPAAAKAKPVARIVLQAPITSGIPLEEAGTTNCKFPLWPNQAPGQPLPAEMRRVCGEPVAGENKVYCSYHDRLTHKVGTSLRDD